MARAIHLQEPIDSQASVVERIEHAVYEENVNQIHLSLPLACGELVPQLFKAATVTESEANKVLSKANFRWQEEEGITDRVVRRRPPFPEDVLMVFQNLLTTPGSGEPINQRNHN